ncbi:hypothetical protein ABK040_004671 [Willaertia magna]
MDASEAVPESSNTSKKLFFGKQKVLPNHLIVSSFFVVLFIIIDLILPLYNKSLFAGFTSFPGFHYPVTSSAIQVGLTSIFLLVFIVCNHYILEKWLRIKNEYYLFRGGFKLFFLKIKEMLLMSFLYAGVMVLTNIGLDKVSINVHVLLRTTSIIWIIIFSFFFHSERPSLLQVLFALFVVTGSILLSLDIGLGWTIQKSNIVGVVINLASSLCTGMMYIAMRYVFKKMERQKELKMTILEMTMVKMFLSFFFILITALIMETIIPAANHSKGPNVFVVLFSNPEVFFMVLGGVFITLFFQSSVIAVTVHSKAISVGVLQQLLVLPQILLYTLLNTYKLVPRTWNLKGFNFKQWGDSSYLHKNWPPLVGMILIVIGVTCYGILRIVKGIIEERRKKQKESEEEGKLLLSVNENKNDFKENSLKHKLITWII